MIVGAHFPSDVVFGLFVGALVAFLIIRVAAVTGFGFMQRADGAIAPRIRAIRTVAARAGLVPLVKALGRALDRPPSLGHRGDAGEARFKICDQIVGVFKANVETEQRAFGLPFLCTSRDMRQRHEAFEPAP